MLRSVWRYHLLQGAPKKEVPDFIDKTKTRCSACLFNDITRRWESDSSEMRSSKTYWIVYWHGISLQVLILKRATFKDMFSYSSQVYVSMTHLSIQRTEGQLTQFTLILITMQNIYFLVHELMNTHKKWHMAVFRSLFFRQRQISRLHLQFTLLSESIFADSYSMCKYVFISTCTRISRQWQEYAFQYFLLPTLPQLDSFQSYHETILRLLEHLSNFPANFHCKTIFSLAKDRHIKLSLTSLAFL